MFDYIVVHFDPLSASSRFFVRNFVNSLNVVLEWKKRIIAWIKWTLIATRWKKSKKKSYLVPLQIIFSDPPPSFFQNKKFSPKPPRTDSQKLKRVFDTLFWLSVVKNAEKSRACAHSKIKIVKYQVVVSTNQLSYCLYIHMHENVETISQIHIPGSWVTGYAIIKHCCHLQT